MTTSIPQPADQPMNSTGDSEEARAAMPTQLSGQQPKLPGEEASNSQSFYFEEEQPDLEASFVAPFQLSGAMPPAFGSAQASGQFTSIPSAPSTPPAKTRRRLRLSLPMIAIIVCVAVILGLLGMNALAQPTQPLQTHGTGASQATQIPGVQGNQKPGVKVPPSPAPTTGTNGQGTGQITPSWVPQSVPNGWTNAGLSTGDAVQALRTATTFTDREMSLDYRSVGTRAHHAGSFTAAVFLLTPAAQQRFQTNDVRASNNQLFDMVVSTKLIRLVIDPLPKLTKFAAQGQQQFAWVDVQFLLWQSQIDPQTGQRQQGVQLDPVTNQPRVHHLMVLLLRVPPQNAGTNPAMGGTGWLVSNYGLDLPNGTLDIVQPA